MLLKLSSVDFNTFFILTIVLIVAKIALSLYLGKKIYDKTKETGKFSFGFVPAVLILMICLLVSRLFYMQFDFVYTKFDPNTYYLVPGVYYWKLGSFTSLLGYAIFIFVVDKKLLNFKLKGTVTYLILILAVIQLAYPVNNAQDFQFVSVLTMVGNIVGVLIPIIFIYIGVKSPSDYSKAAYTIAIGVILYAIGANIVVEAIVALFGDLRIVLYFLSLLFKISGLVIFSYGMLDFVVKFSKTT